MDLGKITTDTTITSMYISPMSQLRQQKPFRKTTRLELLWHDWGCAGHIDRLATCSQLLSSHGHFAVESCLGAGSRLRRTGAGVERAELVLLHQGLASGAPL